MTEKAARPRKILILTADVGFGHRSAALAVQTALKANYGDQCETEIINPLNDPRASNLLRESQSDYDKVIRNVPELYRLGYEVTDASIPTVLMESTLTLLLFEVLRDMIMEHHPDAVVTTYPLYQAPLDAICRVYRTDFPLFTVITDLADVHRIWFSTAAAGCMAPTELIKEQAIANGLPAKNIHVTGIPVRAGLSGDKRTKAEIREELGWKPDLPTFLVVGSKRVAGMAETLKVLNHFGRPLQLAVSAGGDEELFAEQETTNWHQEVHLYRFVDNMAEMMLAADAIVCKAGGLVVTESLACGLPMLLIDVLPGQEAGNAEYVVSGGAGDLCRNQMDTLVAVSHWLMDDGRLLKEKAAAASKLGRPRAAFEIADIIWQNTSGDHSLKRRRIIDRSHLLQFLEKNKIDLNLDILRWNK